MHGKDHAMAAADDTRRLADCNLQILAAQKIRLACDFDCPAAPSRIDMSKPNEVMCGRGRNFSKV